MTPQFWWYATRASGIVAWALAAAAVIWGLLLSTRSARGVAKPNWVLDLHRYLGALTLAAVAVHLGALVADTYVPFGIADLFVPGASDWKTLPVAYGVIAFWLIVLVEVTSLLRKRMPNKVWARIHMSSFIAYVLATLHYLQAGTEHTNAALLLTVEVVSAGVISLTVLRILTPRRRRRAAAAASPA